MFHKYESGVMVIDYIIENYTDGEPIFLEELPCKSKDYLRQEMKKLVDEGRLEPPDDNVRAVDDIQPLGGADGIIGDLGLG